MKKKKKHNSNTNILLLTLSILQILDGILTYIGVSLQFAEEGNPIVKLLMEHLGILWAVFLVKSIAIGCIYFIYKAKINGKMTSFLVSCNVVYFIVVCSWLALILH